MRLARRRGEPSTPGDPTGDPGGASDAPPAPTAPKGAPVAAFAGLLDGRRLWLAVDARPGSLALRPTAGGEVVAVPDDATDDQPAYLAARLDLDALPADPLEVSYDVVLAPPGGRTPAPVWTAPLDVPHPQPAVAPTPDGRARWALLRSPDGFLQVRRRPLPAAATLTGLATTRTSATLTLRLPADDAGARLALLGEDDSVLATYPLDGRPDQTTATITCEPLVDVVPQGTRVVVGQPGTWLLVRRHHSDLADPGRGAVLPELHLDEAALPLARLRWTGQATLNLRVLEQEQP